MKLEKEKENLQTNECLEGVGSNCLAFVESHLSYILEIHLHHLQVNKSFTLS
jgi:hypothetical protein